jgi:hypothetical protein
MRGTGTITHASAALTPESPDGRIAHYVRTICHREFRSGYDYPYFCGVNRGMMTREEVDAYLVEAFRDEFIYERERGWSPTAERVAMVLCHG